jgi:hypothetical protein
MAKWDRFFAVTRRLAISFVISRAAGAASGFLLLRICRLMSGYKNEFVCSLFCIQECLCLILSVSLILVLVPKSVNL